MVSLVLLVGALTILNSLEVAPILELKPDASVYHSADIINLTVTVHSAQNINGTLFLDGVNGRFHQESPFTVSAGKTVKHITHRLPSCNVCGGIRPGNYSITARLVYDSEINDTVFITINQ